MRNYASPGIRELRAQIFYAAREIRSRYALSLENLLPEISDQRTYPYEYVFFRITGFPAEGKDGYIAGDTLQSDLARLLDEVTLALREPPDDGESPVLGYAEIADRCRVSERTLRRWRRKGLPLRWFACADGRMGRGIRLNALRRFVRLHRALATHAARFQRLTPVERREVVDLAIQMRRCGHRNITRISKEIAFLIGRSPETIRYVIRQHDAHRREGRVFTVCRLRFSGPIASEVAGLYRSGCSVPELCRRYGKSRSAIYSAVRADKVASVLNRRVRFVHHPDFERAGHGALRHWSLAGLFTDASMPTITAPDGGEDADAYMAAVSRMPVLTPELEARLFERYIFD